MPTIRDVIGALGERDGVDAAIVLGQDGLTIAATARDGLDADGLAALVPAMVSACTHLGEAASRGAFGIGAVEYTNGLVLVCSITAEALLALFVQPNINVGPLLYELHRHRSAIAGLL